MRPRRQAGGAVKSIMAGMQAGGDQSLRLGRRRLRLRRRLFFGC